MDGIRKRRAIVIGATGLVGTQLLSQLLQDDRFSAVLVFGRRSTGIVHPKLQELLVDFDAPSTWAPQVQGDVLFSALGTTIKTAGNQEAQYKVDFHYQYTFAQAAAKNGVPVYVLVSSAMANDRSRIFYTRMKGELEREVKKLPFTAIRIIQPGVLAGDRKEHRPGEKMGIRMLKFLNGLGIMHKQKPIHASIVARALVNASLDPAPGTKTYTLLDVFALAGE